MAARFLLIDGYNLLHAAGMARERYGPGDLQRCRARLLRFLASKLTAPEAARATVVFDARDPPPDRPAQMVVGRLKVIFANPGGDADILIQELLTEHSAPKRVTLVSSDHVLQRAARRRGAQFIDSDAFFDQLEGRRPRPPGRSQTGSVDSEDGAPLAPEQLKFWLRYFGDVSLPQESTTAPRPESEAPATPPAPTGAERPETCRTKRSRRSRDRAEYPELTDAEVDQWLKLFGDLSEERRRKDKPSQSAAELERWLAEFEREDLD